MKIRPWLPQPTFRYQTSFGYSSRSWSEQLCNLIEEWSSPFNGFADVTGAMAGLTIRVDFFLWNYRRSRSSFAFACSWAWPLCCTIDFLPLPRMVRHAYKAPLSFPSEVLQCVGMGSIKRTQFFSKHKTSCRQFKSGFSFSTSQKNEQIKNDVQRWATLVPRDFLPSRKFQHCVRCDSLQNWRNFQLWRTTFWSRVRKVANLTGILTAGRNHCPKTKLWTGSSQTLGSQAKPKMVRTTQHFLQVP